MCSSRSGKAVCSWSRAERVEASVVYFGFLVHFRKRILCQPITADFLGNKGSDAHVNFFLYHPHI